MPNVRPNTKRHNLSKHEFYTVYHFALQYPEWQDEYDGLVGLKAVNNDGMPRGSSVGSPTENQALKSVEIGRKMRLVEDTVKDVAPDYYPWLLKGVTCENATYSYLLTVMGIPCGKTKYYDIRGKFYTLLAFKIQNKIGV